MENKLENKHISSYLYYVCLNHMNTEEFEGKVIPFDSDDIIIFSSFDDFIIKMDKYMDQHGPQSYQDKRSLTKENNKSLFVLPNKAKNTHLDKFHSSEFACVYMLYMVSRRNTEWQGVIYYNGEQKLEFSTIVDITNFFAKENCNKD